MKFTFMGKYCCIFWMPQEAGAGVVCGLLYRKAQDTEEKESGSQNELVRQAVAYIQQNYRNPLTLKETAEYVGLSPSYF